MSSPRIKGAPWTTLELEQLRAAYATGGIKAAQAALPHRSIGALYHRTRRSRMAQRRRRWTVKDDAKLRQLWSGDMTVAEIATALGRSPCTTYWRAQKLGLPLGLPDGWEYLHSAAKRTGFCTRQLRTMLKAAGVSIRPVLARPSNSHGKYRGRRRNFGMVWPADVDIAVAEWLQREPLERIAKRHGVASETLRKRLKALGGKAPRRKRRWLVREEEAQRALGANLVRKRTERGRYSGAAYAETGAPA